jgi:hypothetical protein
MEMKFKRLHDKEDIEVVSYLKDFLKENPNTDIYIGTDSQVHGRSTTYAVVIVLHRKGRGGHVLYYREVIPKTFDLFTKIFKEVEMSLEVAEYLVANGIKKAKKIDIDINPDKRYKSNIVLASAMGLLAGYGYEGRMKPYAWASSHVADKLCK